MEKKRPLVYTEIDKQRDEYIRANKDIFYKITSSEIGSRVNEAPKEKKYVSDGSFTKHLMKTGMYKYSGLNCSSDKERVINGSKDWQLKL